MPDDSIGDGHRMWRDLSVRRRRFVSPRAKVPRAPELFGARGTFGRGGEGGAEVGEEGDAEVDAEVAPERDHPEQWCRWCNTSQRGSISRSRAGSAASIEATSSAESGPSSSATICWRTRRATCTASSPASVTWISEARPSAGSGVRETSALPSSSATSRVMLGAETSSACARSARRIGPCLATDTSVDSRL